LDCGEITTEHTNHTKPKVRTQSRPRRKLSSLIGSVPFVSFVCFVVYSIAGS
jgi:hypothetical protein